MISVLPKTQIHFLLLFPVKLNQLYAVIMTEMKLAAKLTEFKVIMYSVQVKLIAALFMSIKISSAKKEKIVKTVKMS